jgi:hypothetical protein
MRLHPGVGFPLEHIVPEGGLTVGNIHLPGGTIVGMNAWVIHRDKNVYGEDADIFRPERWIETEPGRLRMMEKCFLSVSELPLNHCLHSDKNIVSVWSWNKDVYWYEHFNHGDWEIGASISERVRHHMGRPRRLVEDHNLLVRRADGFSRQVAPKKEKKSHSVMN